MRLLSVIATSAYLTSKYLHTIVSFTVLLALILSVVVMKYAIVAPERNSTSAGIEALHLLNEHLCALGEESRMVVLGKNYPQKDEVVIYPDCVIGNPYRAQKVVRYLLMYAGYFGQDKTFPESEYLYYYMPDFIIPGVNEGNILTIPPIYDDRFPYSDKPRYGTCYLAIKYQDYFRLPPFDLPPDCIRITKLHDLPALFSVIKKMITFDNSAINIEAAMAGVEVEYRFNEKFTGRFVIGDYFDWNDVRGSYQRMKEVYHGVHLPQFISRTKERFG